MSTTRIRPLAALAALVVVGLTACTPNTTESGADPASTSTGGPVTVESCGETLTFDTPPQRIVSTGQTTTEILLALGVESQIAGVYRTFNEVPEEYRAAFESVPKLAGEEDAPREVVLAAEPDLVVANFPFDDFDEALGVATREDLAGIGAQIWGPRTQCTDDPTTTTLEDVYADIEQLATLVGVPERGLELTAELRAEVQETRDATAALEKVRALAYSNGEGPLGVTGSGVGSEMFAAAGGENVFADLGETFGRVSVETAAERNPQVFLTIQYSPGPTAAEKADFLFATLPTTEAAQQQRACPIDDVAMGPGIRIGSAVRAIAECLHPDAFN